MRPDSPSTAAAARLELVLHCEDGAPWALRISPGIERFIGAYPRLDGIQAEGPLLEFRPVCAA